MTTVTIVDLGRVAPRSGMADDDYRGRVLHLPNEAMVVVAEARRGEDWWCRVLARRVPVMGRGHVRVSPAGLAAGQTTIKVDRDGDADGWAMAWQARVWTCWPGGRMPMLARVLVEDARVAGSVELVLTSVVRHRVLNAAHLRGFALRSLLDRLLASGLLSATARTDGGRESYTLTIPPPASSTVDIR